jgi:putative ABC transport system permease protein
MVGMELVAGRWFSKQDDGQNIKPVLVNQSFVDTYFPGEDIIGKDITDDDSKSRIRTQVIGVFTDFRQLGELSKIQPYMFDRLVVDKPSEMPLSGLEIKLRAGTPIIFEERLLTLLKNLAPNWEYEVTAWSKTRQANLKQALIPLISLAIVGTFLIVMVAMGLFGVLWQNVTSRTQEIGLRRAIGATAKQIHQQVIVELLLVCALGMVIATLLLVQLPILGVFQELNWALFVKGIILSSLFMLLLAVLCAYYPGKVATNYAPAEALHYE